MTKPRASGQRLSTRDKITDAKGHKHRHPFSYGFKASSDDIGKRKVRNRKK